MFLLPDLHHRRRIRLICAASMTIQAPIKTLHLFDLNELPTLPFEDSSAVSPIESPVSTIASADSTTHVAATPVTVFSSSSPSSDVTDCVDQAGGDPRGGAKLAVDLGLLLPATQRQHNAEESSLPRCTEIRTPARKRLRKLSEYADRVHSRTVTHDTVMAKPWTTDDDGGDVCNHRDNVTKTLAIPEPETKVRGKDDEVFVAASTLLMLRSSSSSFKKRRRDFFPSIIQPSIPDDGLGGRDSGPSASTVDLAASDPSSPRSLGSGGSVLLRPSNKQRYRSMADLMVQTPIIRRRVT